MNKLQESVSYDPRHVQQLKKLVQQGEGLTLEFKRKATYPEKIIREMIAFANTKGGILLIGISDDRTIAGLKYPEDESYVITEALKKVRPALPVTETLIPIGNSKTVLQYTIAESKRKPHKRLLPNQVKEAYVRVADQSIKASREVQEIIQRSQRQKDIRFQYGDYEKLLMTYLDTHPSITLKEFMEVSGLKRYYASKKLILLVLADVLRVSPHEKGDLYSLAFRNPSEK